MALVIADRVRETTTTTGTGAVTLAGAYTSFQSFLAAVGNGNSTYYTIASAVTGEWEVGIGTYTSASNTLSRTTVLASSNAGSLVNFSSGAKDVFVTQPAERSILVQSAGSGLFSGVAAFTANGVPYANSTSTLTTGSGLTFDGTTLSASNISSAGSWTFSGGTANGVLYLNGSKVATSGTALTFDGTNFANTQSSNASLGLRVTNSNSGSSTSANTAYSNGSEIHEFGILGTAYGGYGALAARDAYIYAASTRNIAFASDGGSIKFGAGTGAAEQMRLTSTGLGIGTSSPGFKLQVVGSSNMANFVGNDSNNYITVSDNNNTNTVSYGAIGGGNGYLYTGASKYFAFYTGASEKMRLDSSGNLGLGVTPSAWGGSYKGLQVNSTGALTSNGSNATGVGHNYYFDGTNNRYLTTGAANLYLMINNEHRWYTAPSGTAGDAITFTQAMTLDASGNLGIGTSSPSYKLDIQQSTSQIVSRLLNTNTSGVSLASQLIAANNGVVNYQVDIDGTGANFGQGALVGTTTNHPLWFRTNNTTRLTLSADGNLGLGVTPSAWGTAYGTKVLDIGSVGSLVGSNTDTLLFNNTYWNGTNFLYKTTAAATQYQQVGGAHKWYNAASGTASNVISFTQAMTLDASGNLLVGGTSNAVGARMLSENASGNQLGLRYTGIATYYNSVDSSGNLIWTKDGTYRMSLDSSGNLGLGVTPSAWSSIKSIQVGTAASFSGGSGFNDAFMASNAYYNGTNWIYINSNPAYYTSIGGTEAARWFTAASGTAGNAITFTQAMTLDASGNLLLGTTSPDAPLAFKGTTGKKISLYSGSDYSIGVESSEFRIVTSGFTSFYTGGYTGTERARIDSSGNLLVGKTASNTNVAGTELYGGSNAGILALAFAGRPLYINRLSTDGTLVEFAQGGTTQGSISISGSTTSYNTSSDYRLKDNQQPLTGSGAFIDALKPKTWNWKADGSRGVGFIAHEVQEVSPGSVVGEKDGEQMQAMEYGSAEFIANIIAELQSLRARVAQLESN